MPRHEAIAGVRRPAAGGAGRRRSRGAWRAGTEAGGEAGSKTMFNGSAQAGPRRFRIWIDSPPGTGASASRKGAGEACCAAVAGRSAKHSVSPPWAARRSEEPTSELQSLMRISYAVLCVKKNKTTTHNNYIGHHKHN